jgi:hypothetical protein
MKILDDFWNDLIVHWHITHHFGSIILNATPAGPEDEEIHGNPMRQTEL